MVTIQEKIQGWDSGSNQGSGFRSKFRQKQSTTFKQVWGVGVWSYRFKILLEFFFKMLVLRHIKIIWVGQQVWPPCGKFVRVSP
jgi:hypothetical protein